MSQVYADTAQAVAPFHYFLWKENEIWEVEGIHNQKLHRTIRQEGESQYIEASVVYVMPVCKFLKKGHRLFDKTVMYGLRKGALKWTSKFIRIIAEQLLLRKKTLWQD